MTYTLRVLSFLFVVCYNIHAQTTVINTTDRTTDFDADWKFYRGDVIRGEAINYKDSEWRTVNLPHDWSIEDLPNPVTDSIVGPFTKASEGGSSTGYTVGGTGWYRKTFSVHKSMADKIISINFDGVYMNSDVWINGYRLGNHPNGYKPFFYDLTPHLKYDATNVIAVRVRNAGKNSRWYTGSGIYRHVTLEATGKVYIKPFSTYITTSAVTEKNAVLTVSTVVSNDDITEANFTINARLINQSGKVIGIKSLSNNIHKHNYKTLLQTLDVPEPVLWSPDNPVLYSLELEVRIKSKVTDRVVIPVGVRSISINGTEGFLLNGKNILLKGACIHHDNGILGAKAIDRAEERKIELLKANGFNAIRCSHNPPSKVLLDACDRLGMLVIDEAFDMWQHPKNPDDYHLYFNEWWQRDVDAMLLRDRNHPSIFMWSIGNEIYERADSAGLAIAKRLVDEVHKLDPSRPVTEALCTFWEHPAKTWKDGDAAFELLDVCGYNYEWRNYEADHRRKPQRIIVATESLPREAYQSWKQVEKHKYIIGDFVWTGMDYLGEAGIGHAVADTIKDAPLMPWPWFNGNSGDIDLTGNKKAQSYYRDVLWGRSTIEMAVHKPQQGVGEKVSKWGWPDEQQRWTWPGHEGEDMNINVYTSGKAVRLLLNDKILDEKTLADTAKLTAHFTIPYHPGKLKAISLDDKGHDTDSVIFTTTGNASAVQLKASRAIITTGKNDLAYISVNLVDSNGNLMTHHDADINFSITGQGEFVAAGNAHPYQVQSFQQRTCKTYQGKCLVILRAKASEGSFTLRAASANLTEASITIQSVEK